MDPTELPQITSKRYKALPPEHQGWLSHVQASNRDIPHSCPFPDQSREADAWHRGWREAAEDLQGGESYLVEYIFDQTRKTA